MVIIIPSYNNIAWYKQNLASACFQNYDNYRIIYIDDVSTDGTRQAVQAFIAEHNLGDRVTLMCNTHNRGALANIYDAVHSCADHEIIVLLDGDDAFKHNRVLQIINAAYDDDIWLTYGQFERFPQGTIGYCAEIPADVIAQNGFRKHPWVTSHLRTFYAKLFKKIKKEDLLADNEFMRVTWDRALMLPMLEMAGERIRCIHEVLYVYNEANPLNDFKMKLQQQLRYERKIHAMPPYQRIDTLFDEYPAWIYHDFDAAMYLDNFPRAFAMTDKILGLDGKHYYSFFKELYERNNFNALASRGLVCQEQIPKIIHQIWIGGPLPEAFKELCESWKHYHTNRGWLYKLWTDEDVQQLDLYNQYYYDATDNPGVKSDLLKWEIIYNFGGFYLDVDYEACKPLDVVWKTASLTGHELSYSLLCYDFITALQPLDAYFVQLGAALFGARPHHPILAHCIATVKDDWHHKGAPKKTGPVHFTKSFFAAAGKDGNLDIALPALYMYPLGSTQTELLYEQWLQEGSYAVHHWAKSWMPPRFRWQRFRSLANDAATVSWND
jgi:glycosyltransferase involved in cell wall biosynthesis